MRGFFSLPPSPLHQLVAVGEQGVGGIGGIGDFSGGGSTRLRGWAC